MEPGSLGPIIQLKGVEMAYPVQRGLLDFVRSPLQQTGVVRALKGIDLDVDRGVVFGLLGPNGAGKTTLIKILANLIIPTSGSGLINGYCLKKEAVDVRRSVGLVSSDERSFFWRLSGLENLRFFAALLEVSPRVAEERIQRYLEFFQLTGQARTRFGLYSSGRKKLFSIIRALLSEPPILVLDEPTNALDPPAAQRLMDFVRKEFVNGQGKTVIWATHRLEEVREICDSVMLIDGGSRRFLGSVQEFTALGQDTGSGHRSLMEAFRVLLEP